jgi:acetyltransferase-like isoleucine patch superfamily enzyme
MYIRRIIWVMKSLVYKLRMDKFGILSYIARPMLLLNIKNIRIGNKVRILPNARIECVTKSSQIIMQDDISIGPNFNLTCANFVKIGNRVTISSNVFITDMDHSYSEIGVSIMKQPNIIDETIISDNCFIGTGAVLLAGTKLGKQCIVGANSVIRGKYADYSVIVGNPGRVIKIYNNKSKVWESVNA